MSRLILECKVNENGALAALHLLKLLAGAEARHDFEGIYQAAYQREVIEFICLLMRRDCKLYTSPATLPTVKTICSLLQSNPTFVLYYNQTSFCYFIRRLCVFWYSNPLHVCWFLSVCVVKGGSYLLRLTEKQNLCIVPMFLYHHKFLGGKLLV